MTDKELESVKKSSIAVHDFSHTTKSNIVSTEINKLVMVIRRQIAQKKNVTVMIVEVD